MYLQTSSIARPCTARVRRWFGLSLLATVATTLQSVHAQQVLDCPAVLKFRAMVCVAKSPEFASRSCGPREMTSDDVISMVGSKELLIGIVQSGNSGLTVRPDREFWSWEQASNPLTHGYWSPRWNALEITMPEYYGECLRQALTNPSTRASSPKGSPTSESQTRATTSSIDCNQLATELTFPPYGCDGMADKLRRASAARGHCQASYQEGMIESFIQSTRQDVRTNFNYRTCRQVADVGALVTAP